MDRQSDPGSSIRQYGWMIVALLAAAHLHCGSGSAPYSIRAEKGSRSVEISAYDPELPGYHLEGDIGSIVIRPDAGERQTELVLSIRTAETADSHLEGFMLISPDTTISSAPGAEHEEVVTRSASDPSMRTAALVTAGTWLRFDTTGEAVIVRLTGRALSLLEEECRVQWVDWYRR